MVSFQVPTAFSPEELQQQAQYDAQVWDSALPSHPVAFIVVPFEGNAHAVHAVQYAVRSVGAHIYIYIQIPPSLSPT